MRNGRTVELVEEIAREFGFPFPPKAIQFYPYLIGAEGEGEGEGAETGDEEGTKEGAAGEEPGPEGEGGDEGEGEGKEKMFPLSYVEELRQENAKRRVREKELEDELNERKKAEMGELERAQAERDEEKTKREAAESELARTRLEAAVSTAAGAANFYDPQDALAMIPANSIALNDDGSPNRQSVEAAIERLAKSKPHLVRGKGGGSGDGGARGTGGGKVDPQAEHVKRLQQQGAVPKPS